MIAASGPIAAASVSAATPTTQTREREAAEALEASFIAEMMRHAGLADAVSGDAGFGGDAFTGFLLDAYARDLAARGGFGLADAIEDAISRSESA